MHTTTYRGVSRVVIGFLVLLMIVTPFRSAFAQEADASAPVVVEPGSGSEEVPKQEAVVDPVEEAPVVEESDKGIKNAKEDAIETSDVKQKKDEEPVAQALTSVVGPIKMADDVSESRNRLTADVDNVTGSLVYSYSIAVPPGRNNMTPDVTLVYNSASVTDDSIVGAGWSVSIPQIQRINKKGSNALYTEDFYSSSFDGELISLGSGSYAAKDENGDFRKYSLSGNVWTVTDKSGAVFKFGTNAAERQDNSADTSKVFKWMIQEVRDTNDNYIKYEYYKDAGQIYPSKITYTGNGSTDGVFEVNFDRTSRTNAPKFFNTGFSVQSNYRITEIRTEVNNVWARKYMLAYATGDNGSNSLLDTIVESGQDDASVTTTLPAIDFNYNTAATDWTYNSSLTIPIPFLVSGTEYGMRTADINGDGRLDILCHNDRTINIPCNRSNPQIWLNNGTSWTNVSTTWAFPTSVDNKDIKEAFITSSSTDNGLRAIDVNGDQKVDLVRGNYQYKYVYINNGTSGWTYDPSWSLPVSFLNGTSDFGMRMGDINGDGLPDIVCHNDKTSGTCSRSTPYVYLNNGSGWTDVSNTWLFPTSVNDSPKKEYFLDGALADTGLRILDINGDGLADLVKARGTAQYTYINNGSGWTYDSLWALPLAFTDTSDNDYGMRMADINGDGLLDILCHNNKNYVTCGRTYPTFYINNGHGFTHDSAGAWQFPVKINETENKEYFTNGLYEDSGLRVIDINADGIEDLVSGYYSGNLYSYMSNDDTKADYLTGIIYPQGGNTAITYKATSRFVDDSGNLLNPKLPNISQVVSQVVNSDGLGTNTTNTYSYEGGEFYFNTYLDRKLAGFNKVTNTDAAGNKTISYFHQGNTTDTSNGEYSDHFSKIGKMYRQEIQDSSGNVYTKTIHKWDKYDLGGGRNFVKNVRTAQLTYDGDSDHKDKAEEYVYDDTYGNVISKIEWGEVTGSNDGSFTDTGSDKFTTLISYAANTTPYIMGLPSQDTRVDQSAVKVSENKYYYDNQTLGSITDGNLTKQEMWKTGSTYIDIEKTYNTTYGIVTQEKDPRDKTTGYSYDSYNLYPATITNALSQSATYTYDYSSGQVKQITDANTRVFQNVLDGLDRLKEQKQPDLASPSTLVTKTANTYTDTSGAVKVQQTSYLDGSNSVDAYTYFDGLGRPIQTRTEMEDANTFSVTDVIYNNIGKAYKESVPYSSTGTAKTAATTTANLLTTYTYDPVVRVVSVTNAIGTISTAYDDWKQTVTDARGKTKDLYTNAYGNLVQVDEHNSGSTYVTTYEYNGNNNLTKITDALSNIRNFTYDGLGRRLTAQDLHASADVTFGSWTYTYDDSGNLSSVVDPKSQTINYTYDNLNRQLTEDYTGQVGTEVTYTYDSGTDGIGRLASVAATAANTTYAYDANGNQKQEVKTLNSVGYQTNFTFDRQGNQLEITNPDSSKVKYAYNTAGQLETVQRKESTDGAFINVVTDFDYGPHGKTTYQAFQNGAQTTSTFDTTKLYRLSNKTTTITGGSKMQDLAYTYDANSNITKIVDASNTNSSKTVDYTYDDLNRLLSATATNVASGQSTYTHSYTYSAIGNILTRTDVAGTYMYGGTGHANPHAVTSIGAVNYTYDNNGNMLTETSGLSNSWDYNNRLTQAIKGGVTSTYTYDHSGQRVKLSNGTTTTYYPSGFYNTDGTTIIKHITTPSGESVATVKGTGAAASVFAVHADHLTGSNVVTNGGGTLEELMDYFPYGNVRLDQKAGSFNEQRKYAGSELDADSGLNYMQARYYNSSIGRFVSQDPAFWRLSGDRLAAMLVDPQMQNSYAYARNNPLVYLDPDGEFSLKELTQKVATGLRNISNKVDNFFNNGPSNGLGIYDIVHTATGVSNNVANIIDPSAAKGQKTLSAAVLVGTFSPAGQSEKSALSIASKVDDVAGYVTKVDDVISSARQNHILNGDKTGGGHLFGAGKGKPEFPEGWSPQQIFHNTIDVATDPAIKWMQQVGRDTLRATGIRDGIKMTVIIDKTKSFIITSFPNLLK